MKAWCEKKSKPPTEVATTRFHSCKHDLESIFYIFCWVCTVFDGPGYQVRAPTKFRFIGIPLSSWFTTTKNLFAAEYLRWVHVSKSGAFERNILQYFDAYFGPNFKQCARELRLLVFGEQDPHVRRICANAGKRLPVLDYRGFLELLRRLERSLPEKEADASAQSPFGQLQRAKQSR